MRSEIIRTAFSIQRHFLTSTRLCSSSGKKSKISSLFMDEPMKAAPKQTPSAKPTETLFGESPVQDDVLMTTQHSDIFPIDDSFGLTAAKKGGAPEAARVPGTPIVPEGKKRFRFDVQFRGTKYYGWRSRAIKAALPAVQDTVEDAISSACNIDSVSVVASTLTETGAHARNLTCHVDIDADLQLPSQRVLLQRCHKWFEKHDDAVAMLSFMAAKPGFHARYSAQQRTYVYRILNRIAPPLMDGEGMQWHVDRALNTEKMAEAAEALVGMHDFSGFADHRIARQLEVVGESYTVRSLDSIRVTRQADEVLVWFLGQSFLRHQLRNIVSCLHMVGIGQWKVDDVRFVLDRKFEKGRARERIRPPTAPSHGLTLWEVSYDQALHPSPAEYVQDL